MSQYQPSMLASQEEFDALNSKVAHYGDQFVTNVSSSNIDSITDTGTYTAYFESSVVPIAGWGTLDVVNTTGTITQIITTNNVHKFRRYARNTSTWTAWTEFALNSKIIYNDHNVSGISVPAGGEAYLAIGSNDGYYPITVTSVFTGDNATSLSVLNPTYNSSSSVWIARLHNSHSAAVTANGVVTSVWLKR